MNVLPPLDARAAPVDGAALRAQEKAIAARYIGGTPWLMIAWGLGNLALWLALWPLTIAGALPLWAGFLIATVCVTASYLPSHDAQHDIIVPRTSPWHWLNESFGHIVIFPLGIPFRTARATHLQHHRHTNDPARDPDYPVHAPSAVAAIWMSLKNRQPRGAGAKRYGEILMALGTPAAQTALVDAVVMMDGLPGCGARRGWWGSAISVWRSARIKIKKAFVGFCFRTRHWLKRRRRLGRAPLMAIVLASAAVVLLDCVTCFAPETRGSMEVGVTDCVGHGPERWW